MGEWKKVRGALQLKGKHSIYRILAKHEGYVLYKDGYYIGWLRKEKSAKKIAELIENG